MKRHCLPPVKWIAPGRFILGCVLLLFRIGLAPAQNNGLSRGAQLPYTRYESEEGTRGGGATLEQSPQFNQNEIASEASNQQYVSLPANGAYVEWTVGQAVQGVNLRFTLPDNAAGTGQYGSLGLYVDGTKVKTINLSSYWAYQYFPTGQSEPVQTPGGKTFMRFDEVHFRLAAPVAAGSKIRIAKDHGDGLPYGVDFLELEPVPAPLAAPANALSVTAYGAVADDQVDDYAAFTQCLAAAAAQGKNVYIPAGQFRLSDRIDLNVTGMKIQGAGIWYTEVYFYTNRQFTGGIMARSSNVEISDLSLNTANNGRFRYDEPNPRLGDLYKVYKAFMGTYGTGSRIHDVWVEHFECGFWIAGYGTPVEVTQDLIISRARIRNNYADGVNFCQGTSNSIVEHSSIRNEGDDGLAIWPNNANGAPAGQNNIFRYNTIENTWRAGGIAIFGGTGHQVHNNIIRDGTGGSGIRLNTEFPGYSFDPNGTPITISANTITACGTSYDLWNGERGAVDFFVTQGKGIHNVQFNDMEIVNSQRHAVRFEGYQGVINNIVFNNTNVDGTGLDAFTDPPQPDADKRGGYAIIANVGSGSATFNNITYNRLESGTVRNGIPAFVINFTTSTIPLAGIALSPASLSLAAGNTAPLTVSYSPANATNKALTWTSSNPAVATVAPTGTGTATVTAQGAGSATIT
ncbi:MAG TPA: Ig-like domain-containing protein, partial [Cytophagales bacterium]